MKKKIKEEKKLSLKKMQLMKPNQMKIINGGGIALAGLNDENDDPVPTPLQTPSGK
ncbi:hypothetical protein [Chryseobacterium jejuense]|uniref:Uncharacterized protein n=1 Tax=Chryseobacterium jejuense TaxID=445960 RepID=A0A2X2WQK3_CHRJE|nr:hypothetical protein [Chryseobacterium jejuense]SDJ89916.1 hypothetical protein SAMN05421542_4631 [Chryseobacterium jejuense]SQB45592.1 Uncharacterised protein [Chryseobacterium jejuense]